MNILNFRKDLFFINFISISCNELNRLNNYIANKTAYVYQEISEIYYTESIYFSWICGNKISIYKLSLTVNYPPSNVVGNVNKPFRDCKYFLFANGRCLYPCCSNHQS